MARTVIGIFSDRDMAEDAIFELERRGYNPEDISIIMRDQSVAKDLSHNTGADVAGGAASGATAGGVIGALAGLLVGTGIFPGIGTLLIGGPLAVALGLGGAAATTVSGAVTGIIAGGLIGALTNLGLSDEEAREYEDSIRQGGILVAVPVGVEDDLPVRDVLIDRGADRVRTISQPEVNRYVGSSVSSEEEQYFPYQGAKGGETVVEEKPKIRTRRRLKRP